MLGLVVLRPQGPPVVPTPIPARFAADARAAAAWADRET
jgi:hypothetical protein